MNRAGAATLAIGLSFAWLAAAAPAIARPQVAIIIDDLGYERAAGERAIGLPGPLTVAILPGAPRTAYLAERAQAAGKSVILHLPLQATRAADSTDPGSLHLDMNRREMVRALRRHLDAVPQAEGVNTHRGSLLTRHPGHMAWLMSELRARGDLYFVDSYTTARSVALSAALEAGIPAVKRDVFLDPDPEPGTLEREFRRLKSIARQQGFAVGIGHPHPATLEFLEAALPTLADEGFELVEVARLATARRVALPEDHDEPVTGN